MSAHPSDWQARAAVLAHTHTLREAADILGRGYDSLRSWAFRKRISFCSVFDDVEPAPVEMDDRERLVALQALYAAELGTTPRGPRDRLLWKLTAADSASGDVAAALARLEAA